MPCDIAQLSISMNPILHAANNYSQTQAPHFNIFPFISLVFLVLCALLFLSSALITGSISKIRQQFNAMSEFFPVR